jgi:predicted nucleic acid-binding protein
MLVLDANILIRAVLGSQVLSLMREYAPRVQFAVPDTAIREARERLPEIMERRNIPAASALSMLDLITGLVQTIEVETYGPFETLARQRIDRRDEDDWPVLAPAMALRCPIWTEDNDFFGCGVATWTTDRIELYLASTGE